MQMKLIIIRTVFLLAIFSESETFWNSEMIYSRSSAIVVCCNFLRGY